MTKFVSQWKEEPKTIPSTSWQKTRDFLPDSNREVELIVEGTIGFSNESKKRLMHGNFDPQKGWNLGGTILYWRDIASETKTLLAS